MDPSFRDILEIIAMFLAACLALAIIITCCNPARRGW